MSDIVILGSGPAGLTAALYAARSGRSVAVWEGPSPNGPLIDSPLVENFPGFPDGVPGYDLLDAMQRQAIRFGAEILPRTATALRPLPSGGALLTDETGAETAAPALIVATGATHRALGLPGEPALLGHGLSYCATCDGPFFRNRPVAVVGGGDTACTDALALAALASSVTLIHRRSSLRASAVLAHRVLADPRIHPVWDTVVDALLPAPPSPDAPTAPPRLAALTLRHLPDNAVTTLPVDALFVAIGLDPASALLAPWLPLAPDGTIPAPDTLPPLPGIFVAGDVADSVCRQAVTAAASGCRAALAAVRWLESRPSQENHP